jgi:nucleoside-diphosphate-sugar epimerase
MKALFVGGTGIIGAACSHRALADGVEVHILSRRSGRPVPPGARMLKANMSDPIDVRRALAEHTFDVVVQWLAFSAADVERDLALFGGRTGQYVLISSASAYQTPPAALPIRETTPLHNPYWAYSRGKIDAEQRLARQDRLPWTVVRPSHTYDETMIPFDGGWTVVQRMRDGRPVVVPGDGTSLWTITHSRDFAGGLVGLLGNPAAVGEAVHITGDRAVTWNSIYADVARAAGAQPQLVHIASETIRAADPEWGAALLGDKAHSMVFDNSKIKRLVPGFEAPTTFAESAAAIIAWHDADPLRRRVDRRLDAVMDDLVALHTQLLAG